MEDLEVNRYDLEYSLSLQEDEMLNALMNEEAMTTSFKRYVCKEVGETREILIDSKDTNRVDIMAVEREEVYQKNRAFLDVIATVGIVSPHYKVDPHFIPYDRVHRNAGMIRDLVYKGEDVLEIRFPPVGNEVFTEAMAAQTAVAGPMGTAVFGKPHRYCYGVRDKIDGVEVVSFGIRTVGGWYAFIWTERELHGIGKFDHAAFVSCLFERKGKKLYDLTGIFEGVEGDPQIIISGETYYVQEHPWYELNHVYLKGLTEATGIDGIMLNIDGMEYKCPYKRVVTLKRKGDKMVDSSSIPYDVDIVSEMADYEYLGGKFFFLVERKKLYPDGRTVVEDVMHRMVVINQLLDKVTVMNTPKEIEIRSGHYWKITFTDREKFIKGINNGTIPYLRMDKSHGYTRWYYIAQAMQRRNTYNYYDVAERLVEAPKYFIRNESFEKYMVPKVIMARGKKMFVSNVYFPGAKLMYTNRIFLRNFMVNVLGCGEVARFYYRKHQIMDMDGMVDSLLDIRVGSEDEELDDLIY